MCIRDSVGIAAQRTLFHVAIAHAGVQQNLFEASEILVSLIRRSQVGLTYNLNQRRAASVQIHIGLGGGVGKAVVHTLSRIFFHVQPGNADALGHGVPGAVQRGNIDPSVLRQRLVDCLLYTSRCV